MQRRIRSTKPEWYASRRLAQHARDARWVYRSIVEALCDDDGRFQWDARLVKTAWPYDDDLTPDVLTQHMEGLLEAGRLVRYMARGAHYGFVPGFVRHQRISHPTPSKLPEPPEPYATWAQACEEHERRCCELCGPPGGADPSRRAARQAPTHFLTDAERDALASKYAPARAAFGEDADLWRDWLEATAKGVPRGQRVAVAESFVRATVKAVVAGGLTPGALTSAASDYLTKIAQGAETPNLARWRGFMRAALEVERDAKDRPKNARATTRGGRKLTAGERSFLAGQDALSSED